MNAFGDTITRWPEPTSILGSMGPGTERTPRGNERKRRFTALQIWSAIAAAAWLVAIVSWWLA